MTYIKYSRFGRVVSLTHTVLSTLARIFLDGECWCVLILSVLSVLSVLLTFLKDENAPKKKIGRPKKSKDDEGDEEEENIKPVAKANTKKQIKTNYNSDDNNNNNDQQNKPKLVKSNPYDNDTTGKKLGTIPKPNRIISDDTYVTNSDEDFL